MKIMPTNLSGKNVLITGVAGFLGSHLVDKFISEGASVTGVDNFITGHKKNLAHVLDNPSDQFRLIEADVITPPETYLPENLSLDLILHLASPASPPRYQAHPVETYLVNSQGTHQLLSYLRTKSPRAVFVMASTSEIYGDPLEHPQTESYWGNVNPNGKRSCYDESKRMAETICGVFHRDLGMDTRILRIFNTYGPRMDIEDGRVIPQFIKSALAKVPYPIYGDGQQTRSYCYVSDLVEGIFRLATGDGLAGQTVNLGNPDEHTVKATAEIIHQLFYPGTTPEFETHPLPADDPTRRCPDISLAKKLLNWQPEVGFEEGLKKTIYYFSQV